jgi:hypothetical protein
MSLTRKGFGKYIVSDLFKREIFLAKSISYLPHRGELKGKLKASLHSIPF